MGRPLACGIFGHSWDFLVEETDLVWRCTRCGERGGPRSYATADEAHRYARALNRSRPGPPRGFLAALAGTVIRRPADRER